MPSNYLLPCSCGKQKVVHPSQAGDQVVCECGAQLAVPTLRQLRSLPPAETEPSAEKNLAWGPLQGLLLCGAAILTVALGMGGTFYLNQPVPFEIDERFVEARTQQVATEMSITQSWVVWIELRDNGLGEHVLITVVDYEEATKQYHRKMWIAAGIASVGLILLLAAVIWSVARSSS